MKAGTVNQNFIIRCYPSLNGRGNNSLLSYNTLVELIGPDLAEKNLRKAWNRGEDKFTVKLRRGIKIEFASK